MGISFEAVPALAPTTDERQTQDYALMADIRMACAQSLAPIATSSQLSKSSSGPSLCSTLPQLSLINSRACDAEMRSAGKIFVKPRITGSKPFNSGSWTSLSNCFSSRPSECGSHFPAPGPPLAVASDSICSHFNSHSGGNSPKTSIIDLTKGLIPHQLYGNVPKMR